MLDILNKREMIIGPSGGGYQTRSTILTSQVPVAQWHEQIGDATIADGILDRLVHNAHRIELRGESLRKTRAKKPEAKSETLPAQAG
jgi:IstB-like ATP binding protein